MYALVTHFTILMYESHGLAHVMYFGWDVNVLNIIYFG